MQTYTFLAIAPCTFTVLGKHFSLEAGAPFEASYEEAKIISAPNFRFRNYVRVITPIKPPASPAAPAVESEPAVVEDEKKQEAKLVEVQAEVNLAIEPIAQYETQLGVQVLEAEPEASINTEVSTELSTESSSKKRRRSKEPTESISNEELF